MEEKIINIYLTIFSHYGIGFIKIIKEFQKIKESNYFNISL